MRIQTIRAIALSAALFIGASGAALAQIAVPGPVPTLGQTGANSGLESAIAQMNAQRSGVSPEIAATSNGPNAVLKGQQNQSQSTSMHKAPTEGQTDSSGKTIHYTVGDPDANSTGTGSDIVGDDEMPKRVFNNVP